ncbi:MAG: molybdate transport system substrate-binding protein [Alphaproteobacteria bacterium]|jgi:molybdate transport system substrate-binding protein|nr:molybdate transport system substrate-binding protein [Alphaproteobacteria bacterium]
MKTNAMTAAAVGFAMTLVCGTAARAAEVTALVSNALTSTFEELAPQFEKSTGHKLKVSFGSTDPLKVRVEKGEAVDFALFGEGAIDGLVRQGKLVASTRAIVARSGLGIAIRTGAPKPDLGTTEAFKKTLLAAKSISYNEQGLTGDYLKVLFGRLGIADAIKAKHKNGSGAELVGKGESDIGITQASEVALVPGVELGGRLPAEIQNYSTFAVAVGASAKAPDAAGALLKLLASPEALRVMKAKGLEPPA